jgi:hypothetical protein
MAVKVRMIDNSKAVLRTMNRNVEAALEAMGQTAVGMIVRQMESGYGKPIRQTGNLMRDVQYETDPAAKLARVGNTLEYAGPVHDGTSRMKGRPYMSDGLNGKESELGAVASPHLKQGF